MKRYPCNRCGKIQVGEEMVFSTYTRKRYCRDINACQKRANRRRKQ